MAELRKRTLESTNAVQAQDTVPISNESLMNAPVGSLTVNVDAAIGQADEIKSVLGMADGRNAPMQMRAAKTTPDLAQAGEARAVHDHSFDAPLPKGVLHRAESATGADLSDVRVHQDSKAGQLGAVAYTRGRDIHFAPGEYNPSTPTGQSLIAHELAHVAQQQSGRVSPTTEIGGVPVNDSPQLEREADRVGTSVSGVDPSGAPAREAKTANGGWTATLERVGPTGTSVSSGRLTGSYQENVGAEVLGQTAVQMVTDITATTDRNGINACQGVVAGIIDFEFDDSDFTGPTLNNPVTANQIAAEIKRASGSKKKVAIALTGSVNRAGEYRLTLTNRANSSNTAVLTINVVNTDAEESSDDDEELITEPDGHEGKHLKYKGNTVTKLETETSKSKGGWPATFTDFGPEGSYNDLLAAVVQAALGGDTQYTFIDCGSTIGVDKGEETDCVQLYYTSGIGGHIRPKARRQIKDSIGDLE